MSFRDTPSSFTEVSVLFGWKSLLAVADYADLRPYLPFPNRSVRPLDSLPPSLKWGRTRTVRPLDSLHDSFRLRHHRRCVHHRLLQPTRLAIPPLRSSARQTLRRRLRRLRRRLGVSSEAAASCDRKLDSWPIDHIFSGSDPYAFLQLYVAFDYFLKESTHVRRLILSVESRLRLL